MPTWEIGVMIPATIEVEAATEADARVAAERAEPQAFDLNVLELQVEWVEPVTAPSTPKEAVA